MNSKKKAINIIDKVQKFSNNKLASADELETLVETSINNNQTELLKSCAFTAKYLLGLERIMESNISFTNLSTNGTSMIDKGVEDKVTEDAMERIKREYKENFMKLTECLGKIIDGMEEDKEFFRSKYMSLETTSLNFLRDLIRDLNILKQFLNEYPASF